jgi:hypothetical protein
MAELPKDEPLVGSVFSFLLNIKQAFWPEKGGQNYGSR